MGRSSADTVLDGPALREAHATLTRILGAIEEYVYTGELKSDGGYELIFAGPCREQFLGMSVEAARTAIWRDYVHPDDLETFDDHHEQGLRTGRLDVEYRLIGADGMVRWVRDRGRIRFEGGRRFLDGSILDVTEVHTARDELIAARAEADRLAHVDHLTGVGNRRSLPRALQAGPGEQLGLLSIDLDRFKQVNDLYGHGAGDAVLVAVAGRLRAGVRAEDAVLRVGGEEFLVVVRDVADDAALVQVAESLRRRVEGEPVGFGGERLPVTISVGAALVPAGTQDFDWVLTRADDALYDAKRGGRNRVHLASGAAAADAEAGQHAPEDADALRVARALAVATGEPERLDAIAELAATVAARLGLPSSTVLRCRVAALIHGFDEDVLQRIPDLRLLVPAVRGRRQRFDTGVGVPLEARVLAAVTAWTAMTDDRSQAEALAALRDMAGTVLDPAVVSALEALAAPPGALPVAA